ncbi:hypothetical protein ACFWWT_32395 [Streptomyces sp. NPDC058676]|uniref:hypothetical protein n=1 Tax=unclassified Streptomyces TaxID=2593676 RepID=UPI003650F7FF
MFVAGPVHAPKAAVVRAALSAAWHVRLQHVDTVWLDMDCRLPMTNPSSARTEPGRPPAEHGSAVSTEVVERMMGASSGRTHVPRPRTVLGATIRPGPVGVRRCP